MMATVLLDVPPPLAPLPAMAVITAAAADDEDVDSTCMESPRSVAAAASSAGASGDSAHAAPGVLSVSVLSTPPSSAASSATPAAVVYEESEQETALRQRKIELVDEIMALKREIELVNRQLGVLEDYGAAGKIEQERQQQKQQRTQQEEQESARQADQEEERRRWWQQGKKKFNISAQKGIDYLVEKGLLENTVDAIATFLQNEDQSLDKTSIGEYLGEGKPFNISVLKLFIEKQNFSSLSFEKALRKFLACFRLPGEAQKIDRMMELFAQKFCLNNPDVFASPDTAYVLAFSTIMLNTDLHNPSVKNKITKPGFVKNNKGINEGGDLPEKLLSEIYDSILRDEIKMDETNKNDISSSFFNPERDGFMVKQGGRIKTWKRRWFVLTGNCLYYFKDPMDAAPCGIIPLENLEVRSLDESGSLSNKFKYRFQLYNPIESDSKSAIKAAKTGADGKVIEGRHQSYLFATDSEDERADWILKVKANMAKPPIYTLLQAKKEKVKQGQGDAAAQFRESDDEA